MLTTTMVTPTTSVAGKSKTREGEPMITQMGVSSREADGEEGSVGASMGTGAQTTSEGAKESKVLDEIRSMLSAMRGD